MENSHRFFRNASCAYFPCHQGLAREDFNCLLCFCPLYFLPECGGDFVLTGGVKDCANCQRPHRPGGYDEIIERLKAEIATRRQRGTFFPPS